MVQISELPADLLFRIFEYLPNEALAKVRKTNKIFHASCCAQLNNSFYQALSFQSRLNERLKHLLPRRESEHRSHPFFRHKATLVALGSYMELLRVHFDDWIKEEYCCFYPGKLLDEVWLILLHLDACIKASVPPKERMELLHEIRDLTKMCVDHFREKIEPRLEVEKKFRTRDEQRSIIFVPTPSVEAAPVDLESEFENLKIKLCAQEREISKLKKLTKKMQKKSKLQEKKIQKLEKSERLV